MNTSPSLSSLVQYFFTQHLCEHRRSSARTVIAYRDTFRLLFGFLQARTGRAPTALTLADLDAPCILAFLDHLETERRNQIRSRNARLGAVRSFFRIVAVRDPANLGLVNRVLAIPTKRTDHRLVTYLTRVEMDAVLGGSRSSHLDREPRSCLAADDVQQRRTSLRSHQPPLRAGRLRFEHLRPTTW